ncbi:MAG: N-6 DNA methylase [Rhodobacterales bacterium]|nr:N-6 DNA methylase [Rhodobacterales bacterium]
MSQLRAALSAVPDLWRDWGLAELQQGGLGRFLMALPQAEAVDGDWDGARGKGRRAAMGQVFTPPQMARLMARLAQVERRGNTALDVLDPACGAGSLLAAVVERRLQSGWELHQALGHIEGWDQDVLAAWACRARLVMLAISHRAHQASPPGPLRVYAVDALSNKGPPEQLRKRRGRFSKGLAAVIGNPPYLEAKRMRRAAPGLKERLRERFPQLGGAFDLYLAFAYLGLEFLGEQGELVLLVPNKITQSRYAAPFRQDVFRRHDLHLRHLVDFSRTKPRPFPGTGVYPVVLHLHVGPDAPGARMRRVDRLEQTDSEDWQRVSQSSIGEVGGETPFFVPFATTWPHLVSCFREQRLGDVAELRTTCSFHKKGLREKFVSKEKPSRFAYPYLGVHSRSRRNEVSAFRVDWAGGWICYDQQTLKEEHGNKLPPLQIFIGPKVVFCQHALRMLAVADPQGKWVSKDVFPIARPTDANWSLFKLTALFNSTVFTALYNTVYQGIVVGGETYHYLPAFLKHIPVPAGEHPAMARAAGLAEKLHNAKGDLDLTDWRALDLAVCEAYGLTADQRKDLVQTHLTRVGAQSPG